MFVVWSTKASAVISNYSKAHPLLFGIDMDYPPMEYVDEEGEPSGYDIEFTKELMRRLNLPMTYSPNSWKNISGDVLHGRVDLAMMVYSPYRKDSTNYSRAVFRLYYQVVYRSNEQKKFDMRNISGHSIAYMASRLITDTLIRAGAKLFVVEDLAEAVRDLASGEYDAIICFRYQAKYIMEKYRLTNLVAEDLSLTPREYCYVSHDKELIGLINKELEKMEAEGFIDEYYSGVKASFGGTVIPEWIWYLLLALVFTFLLVLVIVLRRNQRKLRHEMERAQRSERMKTIFLNNISHALRTPLNSIIGFSDVLRNEDETLVPEERRRLAGLVNDSGGQLLYFINELLELSDLETRELLFKRTEIDLHKAMESYAEEVTPKLQQGVKMKVHGDGNQRIMADEKLMHFVVMHFLNNAATYTNRGIVTLTYKTEADKLYIGVKDTGAGVSEKLRDNVFGLMTDKDSFVENEFTGLGLTTCKAIIDRCGGEIGLESPARGGALFWVKVPVKVIK